MKLDKKLCYFIAGALAVLAFIMAFVSPLKSAYNGEGAKFADVYFDGEHGSQGAIIVFIGLIVALLAGIYFVASNFVEIPFDKFIKLGLIVLLVVIAILCFCTKGIYIRANLPEGMPKAYKKEYLDRMRDMIKLNIGAILAGVFALLSAAAAGFATLMLKD